MSAAPYDPAFACRPEPHIVVAVLSGLNCEARIAGIVAHNTAVGLGTDPESAIADLCERDPRAIGLPSEVRESAELNE